MTQNDEFIVYCCFDEKKNDKFIVKFCFYRDTIMKIIYCFKQTTIQNLVFTFTLIKGKKYENR